MEHLIPFQRAIRFPCHWPHDLPLKVGVQLLNLRVTVMGLVLWSVFGIMHMEWPIILTNMVCFCLSVFILTMKLLPARQREEIASKLDPER